MYGVTLLKGGRITKYKTTCIRANVPKVSKMLIVVFEIKRLVIFKRSEKLVFMQA